MQSAQPGQWRCSTRDDAGEQCALVQNHAGAHRTTKEVEAAGPPMQPPIVVHTYKARTNAEATARFAQHAAEMSAQGYAPMNQSWVAPSGIVIGFVAAILFGVAGWLFAGVVGALIGLALGVVVLLMVAQQPGTLTVTYQQQAPAPRA